MSFETPAALWGLGALLLLALFSLWRQAAVRTVVPSLSLWKKIPERNPPIRALRRPAWRWELLCIAVAIAAAVAGMAGPYVELDRPKPRKLGIVIDTSARMRDRLGRLVERARELAKDDDATYYAADPSPRKERDPGKFRIVDVHVDTAPLLAVARAENERVLLVSDRAAAGVDAELVQGPAGNVGIVEFAASDGEIFARIANHGAARKVSATLSVDGRPRALEIDLPAGERGWWEKGDFSRAMSVELALKTADGFATDDVAGASRFEAVETAVSVKGLGSPLTRRAIAAVPGVVLRDAGAAVAVGVDEEPGPAAFRVKLHVPVTPR
ncbi:MAG TPA: BatA domain-containing protein, partial [Planctomycetota bacterium]